MKSRLMLVSEYRETRFTHGSRPSVNTLKKWIRNGDLPGKRIGNLYYVEVDTEIDSVGDDLVDAILHSFDGQTTQAGKSVPRA